MNIAEKIRAGRAVLNWSQQDLADHSGVSKPAIANIEREATTPENSTVEKITLCFRHAGVILHGSSVEKKDIYTYSCDSYMAVLEDIEQTLQSGDEVLFHCADDSRSSDEVSKKLKYLKEIGIKSRSTICEGNSTISGNINDYRWIPADYFADSEISVIYGDKYMQHVQDKHKSLFIVMKSAAHANVMRKQFEYWWVNGNPVGGKNK